jgi:hypothetical protein
LNPSHEYQDFLVLDAFQNVISKLVQDMEYVKTYLGDLLMLTNIRNSFKDHPLKLEMVQPRLSTADMRVNISKSKFFAQQIEYLGYWITRQGIQPIRNKFKITVILSINAPKTRKELGQFIGIFNYYRDMWFHRSELLVRFHRLDSHQARSSLNGTNPTNRHLSKPKEDIEI